MRKIISLLAALAAAITFVVPSFAEGETQDEFVYVTVEAFATGQGFVLEPTKVAITEGQTGADIIDAVLGAEKINNGAGTGAYISSVAIDNSEAVIPETTLNAITAAGGTLGTQALAGQLAAYDYYSMAGWMFILNNESAAFGLSDYTPAANDVIRIEFSLFGYGSDVGIDTSSMAEWGGAASLIPETDKDELITLLAQNKQTLGEKVIYASALAVLSDLSSTQEDIDAAVSAVNNALVPETAPDTAPDTTPDTASKKDNDVKTGVAFPAVALFVASGAVVVISTKIRK